MKKFLTLLFLFLISVPAILPYFHAGYFPTHDGEWAVVRLGDMFRILRDFQIPARYSGNLNFGYGYPLFNFTYPLPYYLGVSLHFLGFSFVNSIKILFAGSVILSAFFMYLASEALWKNTWAGIISATLYVYFPYRMVDLYVRGSIGESLSFALFPLLFYLATKLTAKSSFLLIGGIAVSIAFLIMTHNIMTVLFLPIYLMFTLIHTVVKNKKAIKPFLIGILLGFGLSAFFWIPAILEKSNILLSKIPIADRDLYFMNLSQFIFPRWGYGVPTRPNGFSYQLGLVNLAIFITVALSLLSIFVRSKNNLKECSEKTAFMLIVLAAFYTFLLFKPSEFLWENIPLLSEINYPWIVLGILGFLISLLAGFLCKNNIGRYIMALLAVIAVFIVLPYAKTERYISNPDSYYLTNDATTTSSNELMPLWVKKIPLQRAEKKVEIIDGSGSIENISFNSKRIDFSVNISSQSIVRINTIYFPGWRVIVDGGNAPISYVNEKGVMDISVVQGKHFVQMDFGETPLRLMSDVISLASLFVLLFSIIKRKKYALF